MVERILGEYIVPGFGDIKLIHNSEEGLDKPYYARSPEQGVFANCAGNEQSLKLRAREYVERRLQEKKAELTRNLKPVTESLELLSLNPVRASPLDAFKKM